MRTRVVEQFKRPRGLLGRLAGSIMAHRKSNRMRNEWVVSLLDLEPHHRVLELGCGPGIALGRAAEQAAEGHVLGVDHSELMVRTAAARNREAIARGVLEVVHGSAEAVGDLGQRFDRVYAVNVVQFWDAPVDTLRAVRQVMVPDATIAIALQPRNKGATHDDAHRGAANITELLGKAGFRDPRVETLDLEPIVVCVLGRRPGPG